MKGAARRRKTLARSSSPPTPRWVETQLLGPVREGLGCLGSRKEGRKAGRKAGRKGHAPHLLAARLCTRARENKVPISIGVTAFSFITTIKSHAGSFPFSKSKTSQCSIHLVFFCLFVCLFVGNKTRKQDVNCSCAIISLVRLVVCPWTPTLCLRVIVIPQLLSTTPRSSCHVS